MPTSPSPPKNTNKIHPTNDIKAITNTGKDSCRARRGKARQRKEGQDTRRKDFGWSSCHNRTTPRRRPTDKRWRAVTRQLSENHILVDCLRAQVLLIFVTCERSRL